MAEDQDVVTEGRRAGGDEARRAALPSAEHGFRDPLSNWLFWYQFFWLIASPDTPEEAARRLIRITGV